MLISKINLVKYFLVQNEYLSKGISECENDFTYTVVSCMLLQLRKLTYTQAGSRNDYPDIKKKFCLGLDETTVCVR